MRARVAIIAITVSVGVAMVAAQAPVRQRLNPMIDLLEQKKPMFGVYWPGNPQGRRGGSPPADAVMKPESEWAKEALAYRNADFLFNGSMEGGVDRAIDPALHAAVVQEIRVAIRERFFCPLRFGFHHRVSRRRSSAASLRVAGPVDAEHRFLLLEQIDHRVQPLPHRRLRGNHRHPDAHCNRNNCHPRAHRSSDLLSRNSDNKL